MSAANTYLQVSELDFNQIRTNLKNYLSTQDQFRDYNFEGSGMAVLLDVLAYNTHYNAYYLNMLANEMFLDTAQQRDSVVSRAKELGYVPTSAIGATANVTVTFAGVSGSINEFTIPKNSKFSATIDDVKYTFVTPQSYTVTNSANTFSRAIEIKEGFPTSYRWTVSSANPVRYVIPNLNVDTTSIVVKVQESASDTTTTEFTRATNINQVYSTSPIYWLEEAFDGKYEIVFGQGALGKSVLNNNIVIVEYLVNNAEAGNGANAFSVEELSVGETYTQATVTVNQRAYGGRAQETVPSIKFNAPKAYQTQNRAVVNNDYERIILAENPDLQSVIAFGGELADPPIYGKVYVAVKPFGEQFATSNRKQQIRESLLDRTPLAIDPLIIDGDYTYIIPTITTYYDKNATTSSEAQIRQYVLDAITNYSTNFLERFGNKMRYSRFVRALDNINEGSILNNDASMRIQKRFVPNTNASERVQLNFNNPIRPGTLDSTQFTYLGFLCYLEDDGLGNVDIYRFNASRQKVTVADSVGTIDYNSGAVVVNSFAPTAFVGIEMYVTVTADRLDIIPVRQQILIMQAADATVNVVPEFT